MGAKIGIICDNLRIAPRNSYLQQRLRLKINGQRRRGMKASVNLLFSSFAPLYNSSKLDSTLDLSSVATTEPLGTTVLVTKAVFRNELTD
jgi:hypothetical protein